jgi:hypothetical protein
VGDTFGGAKTSATPLTDVTGEGGTVAPSGQPEVSVLHADVPTGPQPNVPLAVISAGVLALGVALLALRRAARRA